MAPIGLHETDFFSSASNKKTANAQCALKMVAELYQRDLIERFGEKNRSRMAISGLSEEEEDFSRWMFHNYYDCVSNFA